MEKVIIVSADGHAGMPAARWAEYLDARYHDFLPAFHEETKVFGGSMSLLNDLRLSPDKYPVFDKEGLYQSGRWNGLWDAEVRVQEMDREGIAAEFVYPGDDAKASPTCFSTDCDASLTLMEPDERHPRQDADVGRTFAERRSLSSRPPVAER